MTITRSFDLWRRLRVVLITAAPVLALTLLPTDSPVDPHRFLCFWCGGRASADILLNVLLFVPLGAALWLLLRQGSRAVLTGLVITSGIELAQFVIPGRDPNLDDVLANTLGTVLGIALARTAKTWLQPRGRWRRLIVAMALVFPVGILAGGAALFAPAFQEGVYYGQWTADLGYLEWYRGQVVNAQIGEIRVPSRRLRRTDEVRDLLFARAPIRVEAIAGPPVSGLAPIFSIYDDREREVMLLGIDRSDAVLRHRMRAADARFDQPDLRFPGGFDGVKAGQSLALEVTAGERGYCITVNGRRSCRVGLHLADGWGLLIFSADLSQWIREACSVLWLLLLFAPAGFWLSRPAEIGLAALTGAAALALLPRFFDLLPTPPHHYAAAVAGIACGLTMRWFYGRESGRSAVPGPDGGETASSRL